MTYQIEQWQKGESWTPIKRGLSKERAEALVAGAKWDLRFALLKLRVEEEPR